MKPGLVGPLLSFFRTMLPWAVLPFMGQLVPTDPARRGVTLRHCCVALLCERGAAEKLREGTAAGSGPVGNYNLELPKNLGP